MTDPTCPSCARRVAADQRYCLRCGAACNGESERLLALATGRDEDGSTGDAAAADAAAAAATAPLARPRGASFRKAAVSLLMATVGLGILLGTVLGTNPAQTLASAIPTGLTVHYPVGFGLPVVLPSTAPPADESDDAPVETVTEEAAAPEPTAPVEEAPAPAETTTTDTTPTDTTTTDTTTEEETPTVPPVKHVFVVMMADQNLAAAAQDPAAAPYLAGTLAPQGTLLTGYHAISHGSLPNGVALLSGQGPTTQTQADCPTYADVAPGDAGDDGQETGDGCVYSVQTGTIGDLLHQSSLTWRAYVEGMGTPCRHPTAGVPDPDHAGAPYVTYRNPFVSFHTELDGDNCKTEDVDLGQLDGDLAKGADAPAFSYIVPSRCDDGSAAPCKPGAAAGLAPADAWLKTIVPKILASKAYADDGLLVVTADQAPATGPKADSSGCCRPTTYPNVKDAGAPGAPGQGGGLVGALLVSPYVAAGKQVATPANHFTLLRTVEDVFKLNPLGYSADADVGSLVPKVVEPTKVADGDDTVTTRGVRR